MEEQDLIKMREELIEALAKGPNYWKDKDPAKYKKMLNKLKAARKKPGHKERAQQQILQAKRRERGGSGTKTGNGHSGKMDGEHSTKVKQYQNSEKKAGTKLSPDRKDNSKGYQSGNVRNVPQKLNRGRHHVDEKKLKDWKKRLKKSELNIDQFVTLLRTKMLEKGYEEMAELMKIIDIERFMNTLIADNATDDVFSV